MQQESTNEGSWTDLRPVAWVLIVLALIVAAFFGENLVHLYRHNKIAATTQAEVEYVKAADRALIQYTFDHGDRYPNLSGDVVSVLRPYIKDPLALKAMSRFVWNKKLSGRGMSDLDDPANQVVVYSVVPGAQSVAVGMADGFAKRLPKTYLPKIVASATSLKPLSPF